MPGFLGVTGAGMIANDALRRTIVDQGEQDRRVQNAILEALERQNALLGGIFAAVDYLARAEQQRAGQ